MTPQDQARAALTTVQAERDQQPDAYWVGYLKAELARLIEQTEA